MGDFFQAQKGKLLDAVLTDQKVIDADWIRAVKGGLEQLKRQERRALQKAFSKSRRAPFLIGSQYWQNPGQFLGAAGQTQPRPKAAWIVEGLIRGGEKTPKKADAMVVPTPEVKALRRGVKGQRITPKTWPTDRLGPLVRVRLQGGSGPPAYIATEAGVVGGKLKRVTFRRKGGRFGVKIPFSRRGKSKLRDNKIGVIAFYVLKRARAIQAIDRNRLLNKARERVIRVFVGSNKGKV